MGYKMAANIKCLAIGEQCSYAKLTVPFLLCDSYNFGIAFHSQLLFSK